MATASNLMTAVELANRPDLTKHCQLVKGELFTMSPAGHRHGSITIEICRQLSNHVRAAKIGKTYATETGFLLEQNPDTVLAPDAAFVSKQRLTPAAEDHAFLPLAPDFVAEVRSPRDSASAMEDKAKTWLAAGCKLVLTVDPGTETVRRYVGLEEVTDFKRGEPVDCSVGVAGWVLDTEELFAE